MNSDELSPSNDNISVVSLEQNSVHVNINNHENINNETCAYVLTRQLMILTFIFIIISYYVVNIGIMIILSSYIYTNCSLPYYYIFYVFTCMKLLYNILLYYRYYIVYKTEYLDYWCVIFIVINVILNILQIYCIFQCTILLLHVNYFTYILILYTMLVGFII